MRSIIYALFLGGVCAAASTILVVAIAKFRSYDKNRDKVLGLRASDRVGCSVCNMCRPTLATTYGLRRYQIKFIYYTPHFLRRFEQLCLNITKKTIYVKIIS